MALFVFWQDIAAAGRPADRLHPILLTEAHVVSESATRGRVTGKTGDWHFAAYATRTHFYSAEAQVWQAPDEGCCVIHGLIWHMAADGAASLLDAEAVARILERPGATLPDDIGGEYAVVRLFADGTLSSFSDRSGLHQLFHAPADRPVVSNRAGLIATVLDDWSPDPAGLIWLPVIGYRVGTATAYRVATQLAQDHGLTIDGSGLAVRPSLRPLIRFDGERGWSSSLEAELDEGIAQAKAAILLAAGSDDMVDLPITGGKDSRVVLALALATGVRDRLQLFTRGYAGHPDVAAGAAIAAALGLPHRREAPHGSDEPAFWTGERFFDELMTQVYQTDGMVGGWDLIRGERIAAETLITGHMGEVLKAYSKKPLPDGALDPEAMVRLQAPFDPLNLLLPEAREALRGQLLDEMAAARGQGAREADLPDLFYYRNRIPNWLGAIRGVKSFERQPVVPLGAPALLRLAFRLTPEERKQELLHFNIIRLCAPELLGLPFAHQMWDASLGADAPQVEPVVATAGALPLFGNWQYSINHNPAIRTALAAAIEARGELTLWRSIDREATLDRLANRRFDYFDGISMLGLIAAMFQEAALVRPVKIGAGGHLSAPAARPVAPWLDPPRPVVDGWLDSVAEEGDAIVFAGWAHAQGMTGVQIAVDARIDGRPLASAVADRLRPDLIGHGMGDGRHGFQFAVPRDRLRAAADGASKVEVTIGRVDSDAVIGRATVNP